MSQTEQEIQYGSMTIGGSEIITYSAELDHVSLKFYPENPRIYSLLKINEDEWPEQEEIQSILQSKEHVKKLVQSIRANGGIIDPLIVRDGDFVVLEGNSRLAAYRKLAMQDALKWSRIKCTVLPKDINEDLVFKLLGQYHIIGRNDWDPYEQAGYMYRRNQHYNISTEAIALEMGLSKNKIEQLIHVYAFMDKNNDKDPNRWSYYEEYLKSAQIRKLREENPKLDTVIADKIKSREISAAIDIRTKLAPIAKVKGQARVNLVECFVEGKRSLEECFERAEYHGATNPELQKFKKFKELLADPDLKKEIQNMNPDHQKQCLYELDKIVKNGKKLLQVFGQCKES